MDSIHGDDGRMWGLCILTGAHHGCRTTQVAMAWQLDRRRPDVVHAPDYLPPLALGGRPYRASFEQKRKQHSGNVYALIDRILIWSGQGR